MNDLAYVGNIAREKQLQLLRNSHQPMRLDLRHDEVMSVEPWNIATPLRGLSPRADAVLLQRPYTDIEVQAEMDLLLGTDRDLAWELILQWRSNAVEHLELHSTCGFTLRRLCAIISHIHWLMSFPEV